MAWSTPRTWVNAEIPTQTEFNTDVRDNMRELFHRVARVEFNADVTSSAAEATPTDVVSSGAFTYAGFPIIIKFGCPLYQNGGAAGTFSLWDASSDLGRLTESVGGVTITAPVYVEAGLTPTAASHTYKVRLWGTGATAHSGAGGAGVVLPGYIEVWEKGGA